MIALDQAGAGARHARFLAPPSDLRDVVEHISVYRHPTFASGRGWRIVPDPSAHLILVRTSDHVRCTLVGPRTRGIEIDPSRRAYSVGIRLRPEVTGSLTGLPARELADRSLPVSEAFGQSGEEVLNLVEESPDPATAVGALVRLVRSTRRTTTRPDPRARALDHVFRSGAAERVGDAAMQLGWSARTLRQVAAVEIGLSPKRLHLVLRLFRALSYGLSSDASLSRIAIRSGYADQAHLNRDFRALLGESPGEFFRRRGEVKP